MGSSRLAHGVNSQCEEKPIQVGAYFMLGLLIIRSGRTMADLNSDFASGLGIYMADPYGFPLPAIWRSPPYKNMPLMEILKHGVPKSLTLS